MKKIDKEEKSDSCEFYGYVMFELIKSSLRYSSSK